MALRRMRVMRGGLPFGVLGVVVLGAATGAAACGSSDTNNGFSGGGDADGGGANDASFFNDDATAQALRIDPQNPVLDVTTPGTPLPFRAFLGSSPNAVSAIWTIDVASIGTIDNTGLFKASGTLGGLTRVSAQVGNQTASTTLMVRLHVAENPGNIDGTTQNKLKGGGTADAAFKWLYPYDKTVFPRGLLAPTLMFAGIAPDAAYVHITSKGLDYQGFYSGASSRVDVSAAMWKVISQTAGASDPVKVEVTKISAGLVTGPIAETWTIAQGSLKGTVYYNSYSSALAGGGAQNGAVLRIKPGAANAELLIGGPAQSQCTVCHAVSADGSTLVASHADYVSGASFDLKNNAAPIHEQGSSTFSFGGLSPDGSLLMSNAAFTQPDPQSWAPNVPGQTQGPRASGLYDTKTGAQVAAPGWDGVVSGAVTPAFSPDGKKIAFNHYDSGQGHTLGVMDFAVGTKTFSNLVDFATDPSSFLAWPAFLPDAKWVVYHSDSRNDYATWGAAKADLSIAHLDSKTVAKLDALNGYAGATTYLPYGEAEAHLNYEPTMLPVAVGGYYWVVFTSRRKYGNIVVDDPQDAQDRKKLWVAAIDINAPGGEVQPHTSAYDASHPAFYLPGQELAAGNMRGFWALDPCKQKGNTCETGDECCTGFCRQTNGADGGTVYACVVPPTGCAQEFEKCTTSADCCGATSGYLCLNGHCAKPAPR
jgi:hypothetical protein